MQDIEHALGRKKYICVVSAEWEDCPEHVPCYKISLGIRDLQRLPPSRGDLAIFPRTAEINGREWKKWVKAKGCWKTGFPVTKSWCCKGFWSQPRFQPGKEGFCTLTGVTADWFSLSAVRLRRATGRSELRAGSGGGRPLSPALPGTPPASVCRAPGGGRRAGLNGDSADDSSNEWWQRRTRKWLEDYCRRRDKI